MKNYEYQLFSKIFDPNLFEPVRDYLDSYNKPVGGFWTSTFNEKIGSAWLQWCASEEPAWIDKKATLFKVINNPKIYEINSLDDLDILYEKYKSHWYQFKKCFWEKIAKDFDCIHLTEKGKRETEFRSISVNMYGWDCESTLWFNLRCLEKIKDIEIQEEWRKQ